MADELPKDERRPLGLVEYALIIALVAVVAIGIIIVLLPAITSIIATLRGS
jgi:Flp pilus assembly pilin Flp